MKALALWFLPVAFATSAHATTCPPEIFLDAAQAAANASSEPGLPQPVADRLRVCFDDGQATMRDRAVAAYLLTFAKDFDPFAPEVAGEPHLLRFIADAGPIDHILGEDAALRFFRLRADQLYEQAKFPGAEAAYEELRTRADGDLKDYATLKLGWTRMNRNQPGAAFALWSDSIKTSVKEKKAVSPSLVHGMAQAFTERAQNEVEDAKDLCNVAKSSDEAREAVVRGFVDGLPMATKAKDLATLGEALGNCPAFPQALREAADRFGGTARACPLLGLLQAPTPIESALPLVDGCRVRVEKYREERALVPATSLAHITASGDARRPLYALYRSLGRADAACRESMHWLEEISLAVPKEGEEKPAGLALDPKEIVAQCRKALDDKSLPAEELATALDSLVQRSTGTLKELSDPRYFITLQLLGHPGFDRLFRDRVLARPASYADTQFPALLAERARDGAKTDEAAQLFAQFASRGKGKKSAVRGANSVWDRILVERVDALLAKKDATKALEMLSSEAPLDQTPAGSVLSRLWMKTCLVAADGEAKGTTAPQVEAVANLALQSPEARDRIAALELLARYDAWSAVAAQLPKLEPADDAARFTDRFVEGLYVAVLEKKAVVDATKVRGPELRYLVTSAQRIEQGNLPEKTAETKGKKAPLLTSLSYLVTLDQRATKAAEGRGDATVVASRWVDFLDRAQREFKKTRWPHTSLPKTAAHVVGTFCTKRKEELPKLKKPTQLDAGEWKQVAGALDEQLSECVKWAAVQQQSNTAPAAKKTGEGT